MIQGPKQWGRLDRAFYPQVTPSVARESLSNSYSAVFLGPWERLGESPEGARGGQLWIRWGGMGQEEAEGDRRPERRVLWSRCTEGRESVQAEGSA